MKVLSIATALFLGLLFFASIPHTSATLTADFQFETTEGRTVDISDYKGKPVLLEWGASWCSTCKKNQESMNQIYDDYKENVTFISLSYGGSRDGLSDVQDMKNSRHYEWIFGLDINNYAKKVGVANGYTWLLSSNLEVVKTWNYTIVSAKGYADAISELLGTPNTVATSESIVSFPFYFLSLIAIPLIRRKK